LNLRARRTAEHAEGRLAADAIRARHAHGDPGCRLKSIMHAGYFDTASAKRPGRTRALVAGVLLAGFTMLHAGVARAALVRVGPGRTYTTLEAAINGHTYGPADTLLLDAGTFTVGAMLKPLGSGSAGAPIVVRGAGIGSTTVSGAALSNDKALWDVEQTNRCWTFEDFTLSGMRGAQTNARGFFLVGCEDVIVQRSEVTNCWNGFMSSGAALRVTVQFCDIHHNGGLQGPAHDMYMSGGTDFVIRHNWIHDSEYGICYKDRTRNLQLLYNRIEYGNIQGYEVSLAGSGNGDLGNALLMGNIIVKSPTSAQQTHFVRFEDARIGTLTMLYNTLIGRSGNVMISSIASKTTLHDNIFWGGGSVFSGGTLEGTSNFIPASLSVPAGLLASVRGASAGFVNAGAGDYHLAAGSPCIDTANPSVTPQPTEQWATLPGMEARGVSGQGPDIGAFETTPTDSRARPSSWSRVKRSYR
jgi:hypothetical protein